MALKQLGIDDVFAHDLDFHHIVHLLDAYWVAHKQRAKAQDQWPLKNSLYGMCLHRPPCPKVASSHNLAYSNRIAMWQLSLEKFQWYEFVPWIVLVFNCSQL